MEQGFRILELSLRNFMNSNDVYVNFFEQNNTNLDIFGCSLVIGENGCGKTELLVNLLKIFTDLEEALKSNKSIKISSNFKYLKYYLNGNVYEVKNDKDLILIKDGKNINTKISEFKLPNCYMVQSFNFADKYNHNSTANYCYLGTRTASNVSYVSHIQNSIVEIICTKINDEGFLRFLDKLMDFLNCDKEIDLIFAISSKKRFYEVTSDMKKFIYEYKNVIENRRINSDILRYFHGMHVENIFLKLKKLVNEYYQNKDSKEVKINININKVEKYGDLLEFFTIMRLLSYMKILSIPKINFYKHESVFSINSASSGEKQMIYSFLNIYSVIRPNSVVVIDEPEISLHPNWQMKYMKLLQEMFHNYKTCHFIIATHSHFMVSDLEKKNSTIIVMKRENQKIYADTYDASTYGWSAEDILYNVFAVPSSRNYYVAADVEQIIDAIANNNITDEIKNKILKLKSLINNLKDVDPLKKIILNIIERNIV